jgi:hypothetical protein
MLKSTRATVRVAATGLFLFIAALAFPANILVPRMELITHGAPAGSLFTLQTWGDIAVQVDGGYKFGGSISFGLSQDQSLENLLPGPVTSPSFDFLGASMIIRKLFSLPLDLSYFVGKNDVFGTGAGFALFGASPIMTAYRGFMYFPSQPVYDGMYQVEGTGLRLDTAPLPESLALNLYLYEDTHPSIATLGTYSGDLRILLNFEALKLEAFMGGTYAPSSPYGFYRGGVLFYAANRNVEFLAQVGIPKWDPAVDPAFSINLFYLLVEPRLHLGQLSIVPTFFWHPAYYQHQSYATELGSFDVNLNVYLGDLVTSPVRGGVEGNFRFASSSGEFQIKASPWIGFLTPGVLWNIKVNAKLWPFSLADMFDGFVGVRAEF